MSATKTPLSEIISISDLPWQERQPGVRAKSLWADPATKRQAVLSRIEAGAKLPLHRHVGDELLFVVEGALSDDFGTVTAGNMGFRPNGCVHTVSTANGATVLAILTVSVCVVAAVMTALGQSSWLEAVSFVAGAVWEAVS